MSRLFGSHARVDAFWRVVRFGIIGIGSTLIYALFAVILHYLANVPTVAASFAAFCCGAVFSYFGHRIFTFHDTGRIGRSVPRFIGVNLLGNGIAIGLPWVVSDMLQYPAMLSIVLVCIVVPVMNYVLLKSFVFHKGHSGSHQPV
ncbi:MAG: GtrA family protein [Hyphomicrobiales bacterium]|nr:GtrA family protein [Hyphomicrobiales bacterium]